ncbi:Asp-tRNA(Asn)/Glu-tRNA(Gln) amidotransferase GatCAB subunit C [Candidatus Peregrinibacteria bacterium CG_4_10_14_0_2_um_filter_43_11]|nr:MAG: Asp-tRNA(Asn)/Glu-tRNA(Gln) amidotransferase GatCAB subunit C [Candidatus Peregrinibacteria bacterium CG_4_10_14_0_2_um_filter_43_11]
MQLTKAEVKHIATLARLALSDAEVDKFSKQLSDFLSHAKALDEVNTDGVEPIAQITGLTNVIFPDDVKDCDVSEALLEQSPQSIQDNMIKVKNIF